MQSREYEVEEGELLGGVVRPRKALRGVFKSQSLNIFQETGALLGQKLTKVHQWLQ